MGSEHSVWAKNNRAKKVSALVFGIDSEMGEAAHTAPAGVATWLRTLDQEQWKTIALDMAHCNPPTYRAGASLTVDAVIAVYLDRAEKLKRRNPPVVVGAAIKGD